MVDPVVLPSGARMDHSVILDYIYKFHVDPFSGRYLTEDMHVRDFQLKERIDEFIKALRGR
ncbi:hypothetical protein MKW92_052547 [Papaver armeniacum]|nr:hypothetical protein MKW92_052547 [Papaver armeniacum]